MDITKVFALDGVIAEADNLAFYNYFSVYCAPVLV